MISSRYIIFMLLGSIFLPVFASGNEPQKVVVKGKADPSTVVIKGVRDPSAWFRIESQHLIVYSDDDPDDVIQLVANLEKLDYLLRLYLKPFLDVHDDIPKLTFYFRSQGGWPPEIGEQSVAAAALVNSCVSATQAFVYDGRKSWKLENSSLLRAEDDYMLMHSLWLYAENFLYRHTRIRGPIWFMTGFVAYFGGVRFSDTQMAIGRDAGTSYNWLQKIDDGQAGARLSFDQVLRYKPTSKTIQFGTPEYYERWEFLGRSFNLVHYMLSSEENRNKMMTYLNLVNDGGDPVKAFASIFGRSGRDLDVSMWHYRQGALKILQIDAPSLPKASIEFTRLSRKEGEFVLDNAVLKTCPKPSNGKKLLERLEVAAAHAPAVDFAQITLSRAQVEWGNPQNAVDYLSRAVKTEPYNAEPSYLLGLAYAKLAEGAVQDKESLLAASRASLKHAALLAPDAPEISYALFRVELMGANPTEQDIAKAIDAWHHGRDIPSFARAAALAYAWLGDAANAYETFNTLVRNARDPENASWAAAWLAKLEKGVPKDELLAAMRREEPEPSSITSWMSNGP